MPDIDMLFDGSCSEMAHSLAASHQVEVDILASFDGKRYISIIRYWKVTIQSLLVISVDTR